MPDNKLPDQSGSKLGPVEKFIDGRVKNLSCEEIKDATADLDKRGMGDLIRKSAERQKKPCSVPPPPPMRP
jgi:hypothetical protein